MRNRKRIAYALAAVLLVSFSARQAPARDSGATEPPASFSILVKAAGPGISAVCERGCAWKTVSARYQGGRYRVDHAGIASGLGEARPAADQLQTGRFSIVLSSSGKGISAACEEGCAWKTVGATYSTRTYRITERGIEGAR